MNDEKLQVIMKTNAKFYNNIVEVLLLRADQNYSKV